MKLDIVSHCWNYSRLLTYQLSSLVLFPPRLVDVRMIVYYAHCDERTSQVLKYFGQIETDRVTWDWRDLDPPQLCHRSIGRNLAAKNTTADWIWFTDCDFLFRDQCLDSLPELLVHENSPLVFPGNIWQTHSHAEGDCTIERGGDSPKLLDIVVEDYSKVRMNRAIGAIQIARGEVVQSSGYCAHRRSAQKPSKHWLRCREDVVFRKQMGTRGAAIALPNVFRIRHSTCGRKDSRVRL